MKRLLILTFFYFISISICLAQNKLPRITVDKSNRFLCRENGSPFFWLGDTAWELFLKLNFEEVNLYFDDRNSKGFNIIQITILSENDNHTIEAVNYDGYKPLLNGNPATPDIKQGENNDYWDNIDRIIKLAEEKGLYIGLLPTWGEYVTTQFRDGVVNSIFNVENAYIYGKFVGKRYKDFTNIIWILGGDRAACTDEAKAIWRSLAKGIAIGVSGQEDYSKVLMTYHPVGKRHSTDDFPDEDWMDFNAVQSGHGDSVFNWKMINSDYQKFDEPIIDLESCYPYIATCNYPMCAKPDFCARRAAYWSVFSGSFGHTYGHHGIWNFVRNSDNKNIIWENAIKAKSSNQMGYLKDLILSFPFYERIPDQTIIASNPGEGVDHIAATRGQSYALIYLPNGRPVAIQMGIIEGEKVEANWFNPRSNEITSAGIYENKGIRTYISPSFSVTDEINDWVLVLKTVQ